MIPDRRAQQRQADLERKRFWEHKRANHKSYEEWLAEQARS